MDMNHILRQEPRDFTYIGIGSCPQRELNDETDQILPVFLQELKSTSIRAIHFDPMFKMDEMDAYFKTKNIPRKSETTWSNGSIEIILSKEPIYHPEHDWFLKEMVDKVLEAGGRLVVQEFTGRELSDTCKLIYTSILSKNIFRKKILFDITYGEACHCVTNMTKYKPLYDAEGNFYNFTLYSLKEMIGYIGISKQIDAIIYSYFYKEYKTILNDMHVNYRRNLMKMDNATGEDPDEIMVSLQHKLKSFFPILRALVNLKEVELCALFDNYRVYDIYKWYNLVNNHLPAPAH